MPLSWDRRRFLMFPYPGVGDGPYELAVDAVAALTLDRPELGSLVREGIATLDRGPGERWIELDEGEQLERLRALESGRFFQWLYQVNVDHIFNDQRIWSLLGYEGSSLERGGYLERGFDDIDWL